MAAEVFWQEALRRSDEALACGALVPLTTELLELPEFAPFVLRRLVSATPRHLKAGGPKPNPFLPWEEALEVARLGESHLLLLNKYPVQPGHLLLITQQWQPQAGWLDQRDWAAVSTVSADTGGLWFFNSCATAGASQPHRHLQLLPRSVGEVSCPLAQTYGGILWVSGVPCPGVTPFPPGRIAAAPGSICRFCISATPSSWGSAIRIGTNVRAMPTTFSLIATGSSPSAVSRSMERASASTDWDSPDTC